MTEPHQIRRDNLLSLFADHVAQVQAADRAASLAGVDKDFAARIQIANSSFSSYKSGARPIGPRIARQVESLLSLERGWMDEPHDTQPAAEDRGLRQFVRLAERAYKGATPAQRDMLKHMLEISLNTSKTKKGDGAAA